MDVKICDLYAGKPDAKDEINYDGFEGFIKTFVVPTNCNIGQLINGSKCFITGFKGTGKTALLFYLDSYFKNCDESACSSFVFFKDEFTDAKKSELEIFSRRILSSISIQESTLLESTDFEYIWRWLFFKRIVSDNEIYSNNLFVKNENWNAFEKIVSQIKAPSDAKKTVIPPKIKLAIPYKDPTTLAKVSPEMEVDFQKSHNDDYAYKQFTYLIDEVERLFIKLERTDIPYFIFVDELEAYYGDKDIFKRDLYLIRDLLFTVKRFNGLFIKVDKVSSFKIICSVRSEIIKAISKFIVTKEINKIISGFEVPLIWDYNNTTSYVHPIMQILIRRIAVCEEPCESKYNSKEIYQRWFPEKIHDIEPAAYILNNSWCKPRDIVRLLLSVQNSINSDSKIFSQAVFNACQKRYSADSLTEITEELRALYSPEQIDNIVNCFTGFKMIFSVKELKDRIETYYSNTVLSAKFVDVVGDLYRLGFLDNYLPVSKTYRWQHKGDDGIILSDEYRIMVHYALRSSLSIGARQDFGLKQNDPPIIGDVVDAYVISVLRSFIIIKFNKYKKEYLGLIHISELDDRYIQNIFEVVSKNDNFRAVILGYNEKYSKWELSKKRVHIEE